MLPPVDPNHPDFTLDEVTGAGVSIRQVALERAAATVFPLQGQAASA